MGTLPRFACCLLLVFALTACETTSDVPMAPGVGPANYLDGYPAAPEEGLVNVVVEIPAGTNAKWMVSESGASIEWELEDGRPRVVRYLAYPGNYGMIPRTRLPEELGGDGDPLDVIVLGPAVERGTVLTARPIGVLHLLDDGQRDDKILAVPLSGPLADVSDLGTLEERYPGVSTIIRTWFTQYKGPGRLESQGLEDAAAALAVIREASEHYERGSRPDRGP